MGIKLFVDDLRACPKGWVPARTVTEAIRILATQSVEEVSWTTISNAKQTEGIHVVTSPSSTPARRPSRPWLGISKHFWMVQTGPLLRIKCESFIFASMLVV